jgi:hypothetical protein
MNNPIFKLQIPIGQEFYYKCYGNINVVLFEPLPFSKEHMCIYYYITMDTHKQYVHTFFITDQTKYICNHMKHISTIRHKHQILSLYMSSEEIVQQRQGE